jgi:hypothetical protein
VDAARQARRLTQSKRCPCFGRPIYLGQQNRGFLRREDYYTRTQLATEKRQKYAFLLGEIAHQGI